MLKSSHFDQNVRLDHVGPVHFPTVPRPLPKNRVENDSKLNDFSARSTLFRLRLEGQMTL